MNDSRLDAPYVRPGISTFPIEHQILTMRLSLQSVFRFCRQIYTQPPYPARWGIEELYKVSKRLMEVEDFHGPSERGVQRERYACFTLIAMTRPFSNHGEDHMNGSLPNDGKPLMRTNFKHGLAVVAANIESLLLQQASALRETVARVVGEIVRCRQRLRPGRSYARRSRKPIGKWPRRRGAPATTAN